MGKKSKRKAAKAAAAAAGSSIGGQQLILGPRPDGITCTNEDPKLCAVCSVCSPNYFNVCCGTNVCPGCFAADVCAYCKVGDGRQIVSIAKMRAREGFPWAFHFWGEVHLGECYKEYKANASAKEVEERMAFDLHERAASMDHPKACLSLASFYSCGIGCKENLEKARLEFEKAMHLHVEDVVHSDYVIFKIGIHIAEELLDAGETEKGLSVLLPLAERGNGEAQCLLSELHERIGDQEGSQHWISVSSENPNDPGSAMAGSLRRRNWCLARYWYGIDSKFEHESLKLRRLEAAHESLKLRRLEAAHELFCALRKVCAWCETSLDRSTRKLCKGCKTHCYCSISCQEAHWNAEENGHRSDCQKVMEVKKKVAAMNRQ